MRIPPSSAFVSAFQILLPLMVLVGSDMMFGIASLRAQPPIEFAGHEGAVMMAAFAADNDRIVTASADQTAKLWDVKTGAILQSWGQHTGPLYCVGVSGDGRTLVTGAQDNTLRVWDLPLSHPLRRLTPPGPATLGLTYSPDGKWLLGGSADKLVRLLDLKATDAKDAPVAPVLRQGHTAEVQAVAWRTDGVCFASADKSGSIILWSPDLESPLGRLSGHSGNVSELIFHANNQQLLSAGDDGFVRVWQLMPSLPRIAATADAAGLGLEVVAGQPQAVFAAANGSCKLINLQSGEVVREFPPAATQLTDVALSPNNAFLLMNTVDGKSRLINFNDGAEMGVVSGHDGAILDSVIYPDAQQFATAGSDGTARLWKLPVAAVAIPGHTAPVRGMVAAASGQWTATISDDMTTRIWNPAGGALRQLGNHTQPLRAVSVRDDDAVLATGDAEGTVWTWNPVSGAAEGVVAAHPAAVTAIAFSADQASLITGAADGIIRSWTLPLPAQKPGEGEEPVKPAWEFKLPDNTGVTQLARLSQDQGLLVISAGGSQIFRLKWDGTPGTPIASPAGALRGLDVASAGMSFLATSDAGHVHLFAADGTFAKSLPPIAGLTVARFDRDGKQLLLCDGQARVRIASVDSGRIPEEIPAAGQITDAVWTSADQTAIVAFGAGNDGVLLQRSLRRIWEDANATTVAFVPNQQQLLCGGTDGKVRLLSLADGVLIREYLGHTGSVSEVAVSPNAQFVCSVSDDKTLQTWKTADATSVFSTAHPSPVQSLSISSDSTRIATASSDGLIRVWDISTGNLLESFREHATGTATTAVRYVNDSLTLISTGDDKTLQTMKTSVIRAIPAHTSPVASMVAYAGGAQVVTTGTDGRVVMTNTTNGNPDRVFAADDRKPTVVASRLDNQRIAAGFENGDVLVWNANNAEQILQSFSFASTVNGLAWSPDNRKLMVSTADNVIRILGPTLPGVQPPVELVSHQQFSTDAAVAELIFAPDSRSIWTSLANGQIDEWSYAGPEQRRQFNHGGAVYGVASSRDGSTVVSCSADQTVRVWDTITGQQKFQLNGHTGAVHAVAMSPDETFAVSSGADRTLRLWDIVGGRQLKQLITYNATMYSVSMHPQGALIAAAGADRKVHLLDMISGTEQQTLTGHTDYVHCVTFSPKGDQVLSYGYSGQLKLWNTLDGRLLYETRVGNVGNYAQFAPDGRRVVVANGDGTAGIQTLP